MRSVKRKRGWVSNPGPDTPKGVASDPSPPWVSGVPLRGAGNRPVYYNKTTYNEWVVLGSTQHYSYYHNHHHRLHLAGTVASAVDGPAVGHRIPKTESSALALLRLDPAENCRSARVLTHHGSEAIGRLTLIQVQEPYRNHHESKPNRLAITVR